MKDNNVLSWICSGITTLIGATSVEEVSRVILLIIGIVSALVSLAFNIYCWYKKAKADGQITHEEITEGMKIVQDGIKKVQDETHKGDK